MLIIQQVSTSRYLPTAARVGSKDPAPGQKDQCGKLFFFVYTSR